ncbi:MAG: (2Fe-2S) ferredoxin domain-containing protein, partial [Ignavibacteria bacterium]|nr:(2Fe-2S) ferredoxin domain-containing protein [Ignavibacteria bacterium]
MNSLMDHCCEECWHSAKSPCDQFIKCCTDGPLCHHNEECKKKYQRLGNQLRYSDHEIPIIFIGMGTCGLAAGALKVEEAIKAELIKQNISAKIEATGCIGYC